MKQAKEDFEALRKFQLQEDRAWELARIIADMKRRQELDALVKPFQEELAEINRHYLCDEDL